jgi:hypothetical protein
VGSSGSEQLARTSSPRTGAVPVAVATARSRAQPYRLAARAKALTDRPAAPAVFTIVASVGFVLVRLLVAGHGQVSRFVMAERAFADPAQVPPGLAILPRNGYDGQFFYRLALNPSNLHHTAYGITFDAAFRVQRIGYPVLAWLMSFGHHPWVPVALVVVNVAALTAIGWLGGAFARQAGRHALWGLLLAGYFGFVFSLGRDAAEPVAAACWLAGLLAYRRRHPALAGLLLAYGALTRETVMVVVAAIAVTRLGAFVRRRARPGRDDLAWTLPIVAFAGWQWVVYAVTGSFALAADTKSNSGPVLDAALHAVIRNLSNVSIHAAAVDAWLIELAVLLLFIGLAAMARRSSLVPAHERLVLVLFVIELFILSAGIWNGLSDLRSLDDVYLASVLVLLGSSRRLILPAAALSPALLIVAVHRTVSL